MTTPQKPPLRHENYTVGWICALPREFAAAQGMLDDIYPALSQNPSDNNNYVLGRIGGHNVVVACLPAGVTGTVSAATVVTRMMFTFKSMRFGLMVGIGGGVPSEKNDIRLGDVVVSEPGGTSGGVIQYDFGKTVQEGQFTRTGSLNRPPDVLLAAVATLKARHMLKRPRLGGCVRDMIAQLPDMADSFSYPGAQHDALYRSEYDHPEHIDSCASCDPGQIVTRVPRGLDEPVIHYGLIASGNQVMRHGGTRDRLRKGLDVLCFEMEAAGLMDNFPCLVVRGICDYSDSHKNKRWQYYAAATAAAYAKELLYVIPTSQVADTPVCKLNIVNICTAGNKY